MDKLIGLVKGTCYSCAKPKQIINVVGYKVGAIRLTNKSYCSKCAPNLHKLNKGN